MLACQVTAFIQKASKIILLNLLKLRKMKLTRLDGSPPVSLKFVQNLNLFKLTLHLSSRVGNVAKTAIAEILV